MLVVNFLAPLRNLYIGTPWLIPSSVFIASITIAITFLISFKVKAPRTGYFLLFLTTIISSFALGAISSYFSLPRVASACICCLAMLLAMILYSLCVSLHNIVSKRRAWKWLDFASYYWGLIIWLARSYSFVSDIFASKSSKHGCSRSRWVHHNIRAEDCAWIRKHRAWWLRRAFSQTVRGDYRAAAVFPNISQKMIILIYKIRVLEPGRQAAALVGQPLNLLNFPPNMIGGMKPRSPLDLQFFLLLK